MPKYYPINEEAARRAKNANSFSDYVPGSATAAYREMVDRAYALGERQKGRVDPMYHEKIDGLIDPLCPQAGGEHQSEQSHRRPCPLHPHRRRLQLPGAEKGKAERRPG